MCDYLKRAADGDSPEVLIALVPDPVETGATNVFDRTLEAMNEGITSKGYLRDRYWLPWTAPYVGGDVSEVNCAFTMPGVMAFRPARNDLSLKPLIVLVVGESSVYGVHRQALRNALDLYQCAQPGKAVRILGPYYSGSADSLLQVLKQAQLSAPQCCGVTLAGKRPLIIASGTVQSNSAREKLKSIRREACAAPSGQQPPSIRVEFFTASLRERLKLLREFLERAGRPVRMAQLSEAGTQYGHQRPGDPSILYLNFPPHVAAGPAPAGQGSRREDKDKNNNKKDEAASAGSKDDSRATWKLPPVLAQQELPRDTIPALSSYDRVISEMVLVRDASTLRDSTIGDIVVSATAPEDSIFLVRRLGHLLPNRRFALTSLDLIQLHPELTAELEGSLVVTAYPKLGDFQEQSSGQVRHTLSRDASVGMYYATRWLLSATSGPVLCEAARAQAPPSEENLTVGVIAREQFWPLFFPSQAEGSRRAQPGWSAKPQPGFWWATFALWVVTAYCLIFLVLLQLRGTEPSKAERRALPGLRYWFRPFKVFLPCQDPVFRRWHAFWLTTMASAALVLSVAFASVCTRLALSEGGPWEWLHAALLRDWVYATFLWDWVYAVLWWLTAMVSFALPWLRLPSWVSSLKEQEARGSGKFYVWLMTPLLFTILGYVIAGLTAYGVLKSEGPTAAALLYRSCRLAGGASPLVVLIIVPACLSLFAYSHAVRLRSLDAPSDASTPRGLLWRAVPQCRLEEQQLLECASTPGGALYWGTFGAALGFCLYVLIMARPLERAANGTWNFTAWIANNTVEHLSLALAIMVGLSTVLAIIILRLCKYCRYVQGLLRLLHAVAASPCMATLHRVDVPMRASVTGQLSRGRHQRWEIMAMWQPLAEAGTAVPESLDKVFQHEQDTLFVASPEFKALAEHISLTERKLGQPSASMRWRAKEEAAIATYVAFVLGRYVKQIRFFITGLTQPLAALFACTMFYPFAARRALFAILLVFTLVTLIAALTTLLRLERDPVLLRIAGTPSTLSAITAGLGRVLVWGAIPIGLALASYFPGVAQRALQIVQLLGLSP